MKEINDGGPAFPVPMVPWEGGFINVECTGMSLRDWFAGQALQGILAGGSSWNSVANEVMKNEGLIGDVSTTGIAYRFADEMLKARSASE